MFADDGAAGRLDRRLRRLRRLRDRGACHRVVRPCWPRREYADVEPRRLLPDRVDVRQDEWRQLVERMLVETLADADDGRDRAGGQEVGATRTNPGERVSSKEESWKDMGISPVPRAS